MTNKTPKVTVTIPTFNSAGSLSLCLKAIRAQSYHNVEISIIDGKSSDDTVAIAKQFGVKNIYFYKGGLLGSRLQGIKHAVVYMYCF